jgi:SAM-dependent methyltransferase
MSAKLKVIKLLRRVLSCYDNEIDRLLMATIPPNSRILDLGCGTGRVLGKLQPLFGLGVDIDPEKIQKARQLHGQESGICFLCWDIEAGARPDFGKFDYVMMSDIFPLLNDVQHVLALLHAVCTPSTRIVMNFPSNLWRPVLSLATVLGLRNPDKRFNWLSLSDVQNLLKLSDFDVVTHGCRILLPVRVPFLNWVFNRFLAKLPGITNLGLTVYVVARPNLARLSRDFPVSIVIPTRNEKGNVEGIFTRTPKMGLWTELIIVDGNSEDGTKEEIERCITVYGDQWHRVVFLSQDGRGKGQAVHQGFAEAKGDILMILDSDLTMPPEELPKYYNAIVSGHGEFINGSRMVYPMDDEAMRFLNMIANHVFAKLFSWLLGQTIKDTLCGTKVFWKQDYSSIMANRSYFGNFDPFGDFDLLFGAARLNRKIIDMPIRYRDREHGDIKIQRWRHGLLLLRMSIIGYRRFKLN